MCHFEAVHTVSSAIPLMKKANYLKSMQKYVVVTHLLNVFDMCRFNPNCLLISELGGFWSRSGFSSASLNKNCKILSFSLSVGTKRAKIFMFKTIFQLDKVKISYTNLLYSQSEVVRLSLKEKNYFDHSASQPIVPAINS